MKKLNKSERMLIKYAQHFLTEGDEINAKIEGEWVSIFLQGNENYPLRLFFARETTIEHMWTYDDNTMSFIEDDANARECYTGTKKYKFVGLGKNDA